MRRSLVLIALSAAVLPFSLAAQSDASPAATAQVRGHVTDAATGGPVAGALIELRDLGMRAVADTAGNFAFQRIPPGMHQWVISRIGYAKWDESTEVDDGDEFTITLLARPEVLAGITAVSSQLSHRRATSGVSVQTVDRTTLRLAAAPSAYELVQDQIGITPVPCPTGAIRRASSAASERADGDQTGANRNAGNRTRVGPGPSNGDGGDVSCAWVRGNLRRPVVYIDEQRTNGGLADLLNIRAQDLFTVESYSGGTMIRVITESYAERVARGRAALMPLRF